MAGSDGELAIPETPYALSKVICGLYGRFFRHMYELPVAVLRCFLTYGPHQKPNKLIPYVIRSLNQGVAPQLSSGTRLVDWIYVDDVISAMLAAATVPQIPDGVIEIGTGQMRTIREVVMTIHGMMGGMLPVFSDTPARGHERAARTAPALSALGWAPTISPESGLRRTIEFYRSFSD